MVSIIRDKMELYQKMYLTLFAATEDVLELLERDKAVFRESLLPVRIQTRLTQAQQQCKELYMTEDPQKR